MFSQSLKLEERLSHAKIEVILCTSMYRIPYISIIYTDNFYLPLSRLGRRSLHKPVLFRNTLHQSTGFFPMQVSGISREEINLSYKLIN